MNANAIAMLNGRFGDGERVRIVERNGHAIVVIKTSGASAEVALQGAQPLSWTPAGQQDVFWCAPLPPANSGKAIRGGIPICWPWFGPHASDPTQPQHGLVRTAEWTFAQTSGDGETAQLALTHQAFGCALRVDITVSDAFTMALTTKNISAVPVCLTEALHTYFRVVDVKQTRVLGLDALTYRDNCDGGREKRQSGPIIATEEVVSVFPSTPDTLNIEDPASRRRIHITRGGGCSSIVWHPGATVSGFKDIPPDMAERFVCVESGNVAPHAVALAPGEAHTLSVTYLVERI